MRRAVSPAEAGFFGCLKETFSLDLRSLAAFRIGLAIIVLSDLAIRSTALVAHYTDHGALPRSLALLMAPSPYAFSFHYYNGSAGGQALLFLIAAAFALALLVGYRTRAATIASWVMLLSLQNRNSPVLSGADVFLRLMLFWSMFLPLGARYSVDHALRREPSPDEPETFFSIGSVAFILQIISIYFFGGLLKSAEPAWQSGMGLFYAFTAEQYSTPLARWLSQFGGPLRLFNQAALALELGGAFLIIIPFRNYIFRYVAFVLFWGFHFANLILLETGLFSPLGMFVWLSLLPRDFWPRAVAPWPADVRVYFDRDCLVCVKMARLVREALAIPSASIQPAQNDAAVHRELVQRDSWIVVARGQPHFEFEALLTLLAVRLPLRPLAALLGLAPFRAAGTRLYRLFADRRESVRRFILRSTSAGSSTGAGCSRSSPARFSSCTWPSGISAISRPRPRACRRVWGRSDLFYDWTRTGACSSSRRSPTAGSSCPRSCATARRSTSSAMARR